MTRKKICDALRSLRNNKHLEPYINYIRFPCYKNLDDNLQIDFNFPLTAIVGQNGTNKSSVLRAIYGCPEGYNLGNFWFSTEIDPITDAGGRPRFIYSYYQQKAKRNVEVIKTRIQRVYAKKEGKKSKKLNPDYWEPSRPLITDGMEKMPDINKGVEGRTKTRWDLMKKEVIFMDFRSEISAFDKYFYHGDLKQTLRHHSKQDYIRSKSSLIKMAVENNLQTKKMYRNQGEKITKNIVLPDEQLKCISRILGREYSQIRILAHRFFRQQGESVILDSKGLSYSEAFAGSGEFAVVMLVNRIFSANQKALIILDEPEVSLHPGAQERLVEFLLEQIKLDKHQIVIGTHSPYILKNLPAEAIKTFYSDLASSKIKATSETIPEEAFFHLGVKDEKSNIVFVEDRLAGVLVSKALKILGQAIYEQCSISYLPGGASVLLMNYLPAYALTDRTDALFVLDEDQVPVKQLDAEEEFSLLKDVDLESSVNAIVGGALTIPVDGGNGGEKDEQRRAARIKILSYCRNYLRYLPGYTPEKFIWDNMAFDLEQYGNSFDGLDCYKKCFELLCRLELGKESYEMVTSDEIFHVQQRCLATVDNDFLEGLVDNVKGFLAGKL